MTAENAKELYFQNLVAVDDDMKEIWGIIEDAAKGIGRPGKTPVRTINVDSLLLTSPMANRLNMDGYTVKLNSDQRDGDYYAISW